MACVNYKFQSLPKVPSRQISMSRKENVILKMVLLGITGHKCGVCLLLLLLGFFWDFVCLFLFWDFLLDLRLSLSSLLSLAALWAEEALRSLPPLPKQEEHDLNTLDRLS